MAFHYRSLQSQTSNLKKEQKSLRKQVVEMTKELEISANEAAKKVRFEFHLTHSKPVYFYIIKSLYTKTNTILYSVSTQSNLASLTLTGSGS